MYLYMRLLTVYTQPSAAAIMSVKPHCNRLRLSACHASNLNARMCSNACEAAPNCKTGSLAVKALKSVVSQERVVGTRNFSPSIVLGQAPVARRAHPSLNAGQTRPRLIRGQAKACAKTVRHAQGCDASGLLSTTSAEVAHKGLPGVRTASAAAASAQRYKRRTCYARARAS